VTGPEQNAPTGWLADTHAHLYSCFPVQGYLENAIRNMGPGRRGPGAESTGTGCLLIAETATDRSFSRLLEAVPRLEGRLSLRGTTEPETVIVASPAGVELVLVGGRQLVSSEGLEILVYGGARTEVEDGQSADSILERAADPDSVAIVPWGFGKWCFGRGGLVRRLLRERADSFTLGDNGGRPVGTPRPGVFRLAAQLNVPILPGSDPLPLASQSSRVGSYGVVLPCIPDFDRPAAQLVSLLRDRAVPRATFGGRVGLVQFAIAQAKLQADRVR
jgi:hypothetical protein